MSLPMCIPPPKGGVPAVNVRLGGLPNVLNGFIQAQ